MKALDRSVQIFESTGFLVGMFLGLLIGFHLCVLYLTMPAGVP